MTSFKMVMIDNYIYCTILAFESIDTLDWAALEKPSLLNLVNLVFLIPNFIPKSIYNECTHSAEPSPQV